MMNRASCLPQHYVQLITPPTHTNPNTFTPTYHPQTQPLEQTLDNKCAWLVVHALDRATPSQRATIEDNYGVWDDAKGNKMKAIYRDVHVLWKCSVPFDQSEYSSNKRLR